MAQSNGMRVTVGTAAIISGAGVPSNPASKGTIYINTTATTAATRLYINSDGASTWVAFTAAA